MTIYLWCLNLIVLVRIIGTVKVQEVDTASSSLFLSRLHNDIPRFSDPIKNVTAAVGREAVLTCSVTDLGNYKVGWMKIDDQTILSLHTRVITHNPRITVTHDDNLRKWQLKIRQLRESDRGCYMCQINTEKMKMQVGCVDVQVPPDINDSGTSNDVTVSEGENVTLTCNASGHPLPRILWRKEEGTPITRKDENSVIQMVNPTERPTLTLLGVNRHQMGHYLCIASNDVPPAVSKRIKLNINFAPVIRRVLSLVGVPLTETTQIECEVESYPISKNVWSKEDKILDDSSKYKIEEIVLGGKKRMILTIFNVTKDDYGSYTCVSSNTLGSAEGVISLYEIITTTTSTTTTTTTTTIYTTSVVNKEYSTVMETTSINERTTRTVYQQNMEDHENLSENWLFPSVAPAPLELETFSSRASFFVNSISMIVFVTMLICILS